MHGALRLVRANNNALPITPVRSNDFVVVVVVVVVGNRGRCPAGEVNAQNYGRGLELRVNGITVQDMVRFDEACSLLQGPNDTFEWAPNDQKQFRLEAKVSMDEDDPQPVTYVRITAVVLIGANKE